MENKKYFNRYMDKKNPKKEIIGDVLAFITCALLVVLSGVVILIIQ